MKFKTVLKKSRDLAAEADISSINFLAVQINITGDDPGVFYVEVKDGRISVEPYEYYDRQCAISLSGDDFNRIISGKLDPIKAYDEGRLKADGDLDKALVFTRILQQQI